MLEDWWEGRRFFCKVQWYEDKPDRRAKLKVWGEDKTTGEEKAERLYVSLQPQKRGLEYRSLRNEGGKCLDVHLEDLAINGGRVQIWDCNNEIQQRWKFDKGRLMNEGGKCLDVHVVDLKKDGGKVQIWDCNTEIQQQWKFDNKGRLVNGGGKCLDIHIEDLNKNGGKVQIWECRDATNQRWQFVE